MASTGNGCHVRRGTVSYVACDAVHVASRAPALPLCDRLALRVQRVLGHATVVVYAPLLVAVLRWGMRYRFHDLATARRRFRKILQAEGGPLLICPNHLTMIDSAIIAWALVAPWRYPLDYRLLPWNIPERANFSGPFVRTFCYLAKCLPIHRGDNRSRQQRVLDKCVHLLRRGDLVMMFPEGRRSRTGSIDPEGIAIWIGRILKAVPECRVVCLYLRGDGQQTFSTVPRRGERFSVDLHLFPPPPTVGGIRASRTLTAAVLADLASMEENHRARRQ